MQILTLVISRQWELRIILISSLYSSALYHFFFSFWMSTNMWKCIKIFFWPYCLVRVMAACRSILCDCLSQSQWMLLAVNPRGLGRKKWVSMALPTRTKYLIANFLQTPISIPKFSNFMIFSFVVIYNFKQSFPQSKGEKKNLIISKC